MEDDDEGSACLCGASEDEELLASIAAAADVDADILSFPPLQVRVDLRRKVSQSIEKVKMKRVSPWPQLARFLLLDSPVEGWPFFRQCLIDCLCKPFWMPYCAILWLDLPPLLLRLTCRLILRDGGRVRLSRQRRQRRRCWL